LEFSCVSARAGGGSVRTNPNPGGCRAGGSRIFPERYYPDKQGRGYPDPVDQIREVLIQENYLSQKDIEICAAARVTSILF